MFSPPPAQASHKRQVQDRGLAFRRPSRRCFACYDTGVVTNGDGLVEQLLPDYDRTLDGRRIAGQDAPLICSCEAAHQPYPRGLRGPDGLLAQGRAAQLQGEQIAWLHQQRLAAWEATEVAMRDARMARAAGDPEAAPWFIAEVRTAIAAVAARHHRPGAPAADGQRRLQPLGGVIADTLAPVQPVQPVQPAPAASGVVVPLRPSAAREGASSAPDAAGAGTIASTGWPQAGGGTLRESPPASA